MNPNVNKLWPLGDDVFDVGSLIVTKATLWLGVLVMGEAVHGWGRGYMETLYFPLNFAMNLKVL